MEQVFNRFKELFEKRYSLIDATKMGEDSIRYDFYLALQEVKNIHPWEMQLEYPMEDNSFFPRNTLKVKRKEKPKIDLWVNQSDFKLSVEFGFFRKSSNPNSSTAITENTFKMLNDFLRLGIQFHLTKSLTYFICVSDKKMMGHQLESKLIERFPAEKYSFNFSELGQIMNGYKSAHKIDMRFHEKLNELNIRVKANLVYQTDIASEINELETKIYIWEVNSIINH